MAYVPPHLRKKSQGENPTPSTGDLAHGSDFLTAKEILNHFWPSDNIVKKEDGDHQPTNESLNTTLHDSEAKPGQLAFVVLYTDANPRWEQDHIFFTKSCLHLLPAGMVQSPKLERCIPESNATIEKEDYCSHDAAAPAVADRDIEHVNTSTTQPPAEESDAHTPANYSNEDDSPPQNPASSATAIAVFEQKGRHLSQAYVFSGWYRISNLQFLDPHSDELVRMLEQKWTLNRRGKQVQQEREAKRWEASLKYTWAVLKLEVDEQAQKELGPLKVEKDSGWKGQSVKEMLAQLRLDGNEAPTTEN